MEGVVSGSQLAQLGDELVLTQEEDGDALGVDLDLLVLLLDDRDEPVEALHTGLTLEIVDLLQVPIVQHQMVL